MVDLEEDNKQNNNILTVAVCTVTGAQGSEIVDRFGKLNEEKGGQPTIQVRGLTRDPTSIKAKELLEKYSSHLELVKVNYESSKSLRKSFSGAQALYLNCSISMTQTKLYEKMIDCAIKAGVKHIVYSSIVECDNQDHVVPHWEQARHTEAYLAIRQDETKQAFRYHILRYAHCNDNLLTHHAPSLDTGWLAYPWHPSVRIHTASARDGARVACKLFCHPDALKNGAIMNIVTDYRNPHEMAQFITLATGKPVQAYKGPATLVTMGHLMGYESRSIMTMADYIEQHWTTKDYVKPLKWTIEGFLKNEIKVEPLETLEAFVNRNFSTSSSGNAL